MDAWMDWIWMYIATYLPGVSNMYRICITTQLPIRCCTPLPCVSENFLIILSSPRPSTHTRQTSVIRDFEFPQHGNDHD